MKLQYDGSMDPRTFKEALGETIIRLCETRDDVIYLDADLMSCIGTAKWAETHPQRAVNCGIAEANMIGVACGLAASGFRPIVHTFGPFASRRCFDQVFLSGGYAGNDLVVIGTDPGVCAAFNGGTHMPFEDAALYRALPGATVLDITDSAMLESVLEQAVDLPGVKYIRVGRKQAAKVYETGCRIPIGKAIPLREGGDVAILASGIMVHEAMQAAEALADEGIQAAVVNLHTWKPLDRETVVKYARQCGAVVTAENHNRVGGLYAAVCETLAAECPTLVEAVAVEDQFGEVGPQDYLQERFGLTRERVIAQVKKVLERKNMR